MQDAFEGNQTKDKAGSQSILNADMTKHIKKSDNYLLINLE